MPGPPLLFLHGFAHPPSSWREVLDHLDLGDAAAVQLRPSPGHSAESPLGPSWDATLEALAHDLPAATIAVGYSLGARLALGLLARDAVRAAILISVNPGLADAEARAARRAADARWSELLRAEGTAPFLDRWEAQPLFASQAAADPQLRAHRRRRRELLPPDGLAGSLDVLGLGAMPDLTAALVERAPRVHLVVGAHDPRFRAIAADLGARAAVAVHVIAGSGHDPTLEAPAALAAAIADALRSLSAGSPP